MRLIVGCIGRLKSGPEADIAARYEKRIAQSGRQLGLSGPKIIELPESRAAESAQRKTDEAYRLAQKLPEKAIAIAFDERGTSVNSRNFSEIIRRSSEEGASDLVFLIGGADGLDPQIRRRADHILSFGSLTIPHQLVRILVLEQIYRATTILTNHPYHRD